ncbi:MAG: hypothetical protein LBI61_03810 [Puniceicoccales bacterium]|jgi:tetratricopeptide (TPR) repeat protein|nr:hypothetical protein [Puniceicoccales bacterium]
MKDFHRQILLLALIFGGAQCFAGPDEAQNFAIDGDLVAVENLASGKFASLLNSGNGAYKVGFFSLAKKFFTDALAIKPLSNEQRCMAFSGLIESCLATGDFSEMANKFDAISKLANAEVHPKAHGRFLVDAAIAACLKNDFSMANRILLKSDIKSFGDFELAWYYAARSAIFAAAMNFEEMGHNLEEAEKHSTSTDQIAQIQAFAVQFMLQTPAKSSEFSGVLSALNALCKKYGWQKNGYPFVRAYALLLIRSGNGKGAKAVLAEHAAHVGDSDVQNLQSFRLCEAIAGGIHSPDGYAIVGNLLLSEASDELKQQALKLLTMAAENKNQRLEAIGMLSDQRFQKLPQRISRQIMLTKMSLAVDAGDMATAQKACEEFTSQFPGDTLVKNAWEAIAYLAWQRDPKDYRMAAHYFGKVRDLAQSEEEKIPTTIQMGNAFYLSEAYDIAAQAYEEVLKTHLKLDGVQLDRLLCLLIQADIKSENLAAAERHLQAFKKNHNLLTEYRWHAELSYINALIHAGEADKATDYLSLLLDSYSPSIQPFYLVKFYLLQAHSMFSNGKYQQAHIMASRICEHFPHRSNSAEIAEIVARALFIKGTCELKLRNERDGLQTFALLRKTYAKLDPAMLSHFEEAEYFYRGGDVSGACQTLLECAKAECKYSPFAYYKCAEYYKSLGLQSYGDAMACLSDLIAKYGDHEIAYAARLDIADLLRMSGRFGDAELVYEELLKDFPFDQRYHFTEFCLAKTIFAQKARGEIFAERAQVALERLYATATFDRSLHMEIAATYCFVLDENSKVEEMKRIAWETLLATVSSERELSHNDIYWLLQIANLLAQYEAWATGDETVALRKIVEKLCAISGKAN